MLLRNELRPAPEQSPEQKQRPGEHRAWGRAGEAGEQRAEAEPGPGAVPGGLEQRAETATGSANTGGRDSST